MKISYITSRGSPSPLGVSTQEKELNFALFSEHAEEVSLCLFEPNSKKSLAIIPLDPALNKTGFIWHIALTGDLPENCVYGYEIDGNGPFLDPYARELNSSSKWGDGIPSPVLGTLASKKPFDWGQDQFPKIPTEQLVIYEMHVRGFTHDPSSGVKNPGSFLGLIEKLPYLKELGINAIELLPIFEFDECEVKIKNPKTGATLHNVWGYSTVNFFTPMARYATHPHTAFTEFCELVKACHKNGIEVLLDVVYNHTGEGKLDGPTFSFRGIDNTVYYMLDPSGQLSNYSGTGNTFNCNHPVVMQLILDSLRFWVTEAHVDGFRFDLASILTRGEDGEPLEDPPLIKAISTDPILADTKLIAEAWDAGGLYQVGSFPGHGKWSEWNGKFRDIVRKFIAGTSGISGDFAQALTGSAFLYEKPNGKPSHSVNFITAHDGFSLRDLVSYHDKHNFENGEHNQDGANDNYSWNCGIEGYTTDPKITALRERQMKNFLTALFMSLGVPMLLMGDEYTHTRHGNNNPWCQDNALNNFSWELLEQNKEWFSFCQFLIALRKQHPSLMKTTFLTPEEIDWHGLVPLHANWGYENRFLAYTLKGEKEEHLYIAFNAHTHPVTLTFPAPPSGKTWKKLLDTSDAFTDKLELLAVEETYELIAHTALIVKAL